MLLTQLRMERLALSLILAAGMLAGWLGSGAAGLPATQVALAATLPVQQDVYVDVNSPNQNFEAGATQGQLLVASSCLGAARNPSQVTYIQFTGVPTQSTDFTVNLVVTAQDTANVPIFLVPVPNTGTGFNEATLTWNNQSAQLGFTAAGQTTDALQALAVATATPGSVGTTVSFNSPQLTQAFRNSNGTATFAVVASCQNVALVANFAFGSSENAQATARPSLVTVDAPTPTPTSTPNLAATAAAATATSAAATAVAGTATAAVGTATAVAGTATAAAATGTPAAAGTATAVAGTATALAAAGTTTAVAVAGTATAAAATATALAGGGSGRCGGVGTVCHADLTAASSVTNSTGSAALAQGLIQVGGCNGRSNCVEFRITGSFSVSARLTGLGLPPGTQVTLRIPVANAAGAAAGTRDLTCGAIDVTGSVVCAGTVGGAGEVPLLGGTVQLLVNGNALSALNAPLLPPLLPPPPPFMLLPPPPPLMPIPPQVTGDQSARTSPEVPVIPEADTLMLIAGGMAALGIGAALRRWRRHKD
jgi:hypothetical protein